MQAVTEMRFRFEFTNELSIESQGISIFLFISMNRTFGIDVNCDLLKWQALCRNNDG